MVYSTGDCEVENEIRFLAGVNWYHHHTSNHEFSELLIYPVEPADHARAARMYFSHAGTDKTQTACRGGAVWMVAGNDSAAMPGPTDYDLVATGDRDGDGIARGYGINGGVFYDVGSVWGLDTTNANVVGADFDLRHVVGLSLFWKTPIGPLRLNWSKAVKSRSFDKEQQFEFTISTNF